MSQDAPTETIESEDAEVLGIRALLEVLERFDRRTQARMLWFVKSKLWAAAR